MTLGRAFSPVAQSAPVGTEVSLPRRALALSDGAAGNANQALALAAALGAAIDPLQLAPYPPWRWFSPRQLPGSRHALGESFAQRLHPPWPDVAIGCGRQAALATRLIRNASAGVCKAVQILDPRINPRHFDLVIAPQHDELTGANVITTLGSLNAIDDAWLQQARAAFPGLLDLPTPRYALLLGGPTRALKLDRDYWSQLTTILSARLRAEGASLMLTSSRRSPAWLRKAARTAFAGIPCRQWHDPGDGANPYAGFLAWADAIVVTPDSVNLLSEAAATRVPVWTFAAHPINGKVGRFVEALRARGRVRFLGESAAPGAIVPLRETARVAAEIRARFGWL